MVRVGFPVLVVLFSALAHGCAPSIRMVHQSSTFFEQCHGADYDTHVTPDERQRCWSVWLAHYTLGQNVERVAYAEARLSGGEIAPLPSLASAEVGSYTASFLSMSADEIPEGDVPDSARRHEERLPSAPNPDHQCAPVCAPRWDNCIRRCQEPYGSCRDACETEHRTCLGGCS